jgi:hypothetical protein
MSRLKTKLYLKDVKRALNTNKQIVIDTIFDKTNIKLNVDDVKFWTDIDTDTNTFATTLGFSAGTLTLTNNNATTVTVSLDGRYYLATNPSSFITLTSLSGSTGISYNSTTGAISSTITQYTDALARAAHSFVAGSGGYNSTTGVITIPTNNNQIANGAGYITSYTEVDTLASVTGRGATTSTETTYYGGLRTRKSQTAGNYTTAALWTESYDNTATGIAFHISGVNGTFLDLL